MMTSHVPTLATCQRLKSAGFPQETEFVWWNGNEVLPSERTNIPDCAAPLLTELLEQLPYTLDDHPARPTIHMAQYPSDWHISYQSRNGMQFLEGYSRNHRSRRPAVAGAEGGEMNYPVFLFNVTLTLVLLSVSGYHMTIELAASTHGNLVVYALWVFVWTMSAAVAWELIKDAWRLEREHWIEAQMPPLFLEGGV